MAGAKEGKKDLQAQLEDLLAQRRSLSVKISNDADRAAYADLTSQIVAAKKKLKII
jgi:hypothetical protein